MSTQPNHLRAWAESAMRARQAAAPIAKDLLERMLSIREVQRLALETARDSAGPQYFDRMLSRVGISIECPEEDLRRIPASGPVAVVANHPFGLADGLILGALLTRVRGDVKFIANAELWAVVEMRDYLIPVDPIGGRGAASANRKSMRQCIEWLRRGGALIVFPAGEVSALRLPDRKIVEPPWNDAVIRMIGISRATAVPVHFHGANSPAFQLAGLIHPRLRTALLARELMNKKGRTVTVSVGSAITPNELARYTEPEAAADYLRWRTQVMSSRQPARGPRWPLAVPRPAVAAIGDSGAWRREVESLPPEQRLLTQGDHTIWEAGADQIPATLREIGRLRELTFRAAGEGSGRPLDLDRFDRHYRHLFLWSEVRGEVVGAYRFAAAGEVLSSRGENDLYTSSLFRYKQAFLDYASGGLELGRSFIRAEAQKGFAPLLLLWKGIGHYIVRNPQFHVLFGPVSISNLYQPLSRAMMVAYLQERHVDSALASAVEPRRRFRCRAATGSRIRGVDELSAVVADIERDRKGVPVLLRQYLNMGGQILDFNLDGAFSNVVDGLIVVDLRRTSRRQLDRYMSPAGAESFLKWHGVSETGTSETNGDGESPRDRRPESPLRFAAN